MSDGLGTTQSIPPDVPIYCHGVRVWAFWDKWINHHRCQACGKKVAVCW